jgi:hypothetical protein
MGNCLVTKLKGSVSGNLPELGTIMLHSYVPESGRGNGNRTLLIGGIGAEISTEGTGYTFTVNGQGSYTHYVFQSNTETEVVFAEGDYDIKIKNKYNLTTFGTTESWPCNILPKNIDEFAYTNLTRFVLRCNIADAVKGDLSVFKDFGSSITDFRIYEKIQKNITGLDISNLVNLSPELFYIFCESITLSGNISALTRYTNAVAINSGGGKNLVGNIESFGSLTKLTNLYSSIYYPRTGIHGSIDAFVEAQCNAETPRTSYQFPTIMNGILNVCTFNGTIQGSHGWGYLGWESASKIYVLDGANNAAGCPYVTCKGYTQAEAEAKWPGKTIIRVDA